MKGDHERHFYLQLGQRVQRERRKSGFTQEALAARVGLTRTSVVNIEKGRQKVLCHTLVALATAFGLDPAELLPSHIDKRTELETLLQAAAPSEKDFVRSAVEASERKTR